MKPGRPKLYWLYFLCKDDDVVYIGVTRDLKTRLKGHRNKDYNNIKSERVSGKTTALNKERKYTILFNPKYSWIPNFLLKHPDLGKLKVKI